MTRISEAVECLESLGYTVTPPALDAAEFNRGKQNVDNTFTLLGEALAPKPDPRADLVDSFERYAERGPDDQLYIDVETAADLVVDNDWLPVTAVRAMVQEVLGLIGDIGPEARRILTHVIAILGADS